MLRAVPAASWFLLLVAIMACLVLRRAARPAWAARQETWIGSAWLAVGIGITTGVYYWGLWGSTLNAPALVSDETSYLFQASLFAAARWAVPAPPLPEFFEQFHLIVTPVMASKYPPGHALALAPGVLLGLPGLMPILLSAAAGGLVFSLARRTMNAGVGLLTWAIWLGCQGNIRWRPSYYSELTTSTLGLLAWWALLRWREEGRRSWLLVVAACLGWGAITRPLTMLVFALPVGVVVLKEVARRRSWRDLASAFAVGTLFLAVIPLWSRSTGDLGMTPLSHYTRAYMPWDRLGFLLDTTPPLRTVPENMQPDIEDFRGVHAEYTPGAAAPALLDRWRFVSSSVWDAWRQPLILFALLGLFVLPEVALVAVATALFQFEGYAAYAHKPEWTLYYLELLPIAAFVTAIGMFAIARRVLPEISRSKDSAGWRQLTLCVVLAASMLFVTLQAAPAQRRVRLNRPNGQLAQRALKERIPDAKALVFVRRPPPSERHNFITNGPFLDRERVWLVHDLGVRNAALMRLAPDRAAYLFDENRLTRVIP